MSKLTERFWSKVDGNDPNECWNWTAGKQANGYGAFVYAGKTRYAHRFSWLLHFGTIPEGMFVCHHCDNPGCVNPKHLFLGTQTDNMQDAITKGRIGRGEKHRNSKLTEVQVLAIRAEYQYHGKNKARVLAKKHGVTTTTINRVVTRKTWKHI